MRAFVRKNSVAMMAVSIAILVTAYGAASAATNSGHPSGAGQSALGTASKSKQLPKNSVGTKQLKRSSVNGSKVADGSLTGADIAASTLGTVPSAVNADTLDGKHAADLLAPSSPSGPAGGALSGSYPSPTLNVSGGPCANGQALTNISPFGSLTCKPGIYSDASNNVAAAPLPWPHLDPSLAGANAAFGDRALEANTSGGSNSAFGFAALLSNIGGGGNSAFGQGTLKVATNGNNNSAFGSETLGSTIGNNNSAFGSEALSHDTVGNDNSALGAYALQENTTGSRNVAVGQHALWQNTTGSDNVAIGPAAGAPLVTGSNNVYLASDNIGTAAESNTIRIGSPGTQSATFLAGVSGTNLGAQPQVVVNGEGRLGVETSSRRFKTGVHPLGPVAGRLMKLHPVSFRYRQADVQGRSRVQYGLLAEQVARVYPNLVTRDKGGKPYTVLYQQLPALLLAQVQKQQRENNALRTKIRDQQAQIDWLMRHVRRR